MAGVNYAANFASDQRFLIGNMVAIYSARKLKASPKAPTLRCPKTDYNFEVPLQPPLVDWDTTPQVLDLRGE